MLRDLLKLQPEKIDTVWRADARKCAGRLRRELGLPGVDVGAERQALENAFQAAGVSVPPEKLLSFFDVLADRLKQQLCWRLIGKAYTEGVEKLRAVQRPASQPGGIPSSTPPVVTLGKPNNLLYPSLGKLFKGRKPFLEKIRKGFIGRKGQAPVLIARQAIHGLGGIGKTRAVVEYAWRYADSYTALLFVSAASPDDFRAGIAGLCSLLGIATAVTDENARFAAVLGWLANPEHHGWLLILDNVDTPDAAKAVDDHLASLTGGHILITGRLSEWPPHITESLLRPLDLRSATQFLLDRTADKREKHSDDREQAGILATDLDGLALAMEVVAAFIRDRRISFVEFRRLWQAADADVRNWHDEHVMKYPRPLASAWQTTVASLSPIARALLNLLSWLAPEPLPRFLFNPAAAPEDLHSLFDDPEAPRRILRHLSGAHEADPEAALADLHAFSLLQPAKDASFANVGQLHRVLSLITRERQSKEQQAVSLAAALALTDAAAVGDPEDVRHWPLWDALRPHVLAVAVHADQRDIANPTTRLLNQTVLLLLAKAQHAEAEPLIRRALVIDEKSHGPEHPTVARDLNNLAQLLKATNRLEEAEKLMRRALMIDEKSYGPEHPTVATDLNNLASLLQATNRLGDAEPLIRQALAIDEKSYGPEYPAVARDLNNLAQLLQATNQLEEAEKLMRRTLAIDEKRHGLEHTKVAIRLNNLAGLLQATNRLVEAEPLMQRALAIDEKSYGPEHPTVATDLNNLAQLLKDTNRQEEAEKLMRRALSILLQFTRATGHPHPHLRSAFGNYCTLLAADQSLSPEEIRNRVEVLGTEAGFDTASFQRLLAQLSE